MPLMISAYDMKKGNEAVIDLHLGIIQSFRPDRAVILWIAG